MTNDIEEAIELDLEGFDNAGEAGNETPAAAGPEPDSPQSRGQSFLVWIAAAVAVLLIISAAVLWMMTRGGSPEGADEHAGEGAHEEGSAAAGPSEITLDPETLKAADIAIEGITQRPAISKVFVTGSVELNPERTEMATPLVGGRLHRVYAAVGDYVRKGQLLAVISSPQMAQLHGKMHEARTRYELALRNLARAERSENRVAVLQSKARLDEAEATLNRTRRLIELGAGAGKDLIAAETNYRAAKAEYEFQSNISLSKEVQEAKAEVETSRIDLNHIRDEMRSLGGRPPDNDDGDHSGDTSLVNLYSPVAGLVTERRSNAGAGVQAGVDLFSISDLSTVYVIANVPEANVARLSIGSLAEIVSKAAGRIDGRISYIDPRLDETTRTARVRIEVPNEGARLRAGMFAEVGLFAGTDAEKGLELAVPTSAIQKIGERTVVFVPSAGSSGTFLVRAIETGGEAGEYTYVRSGLAIGDKVVTKGSFTLKTQLEKGSVGDDH
ncbi:MAG: efflux RND transporter periplasmic adaptor subunit [Acidobacteriota bacterium]|nr:MAG: efflux RND transporter periplasmic adaptor subunit [Acidobacteriota bacterium]